MLGSLLSKAMHLWENQLSSDFAARSTQVIPQIYFHGVWCKYGGLCTMRALPLAKEVS